MGFEMIKSKSGMSLAEVMIGIGIAAVVGMTGFSALQMSKNHAKSVSDFRGLNDVKVLLQQSFTNDRAIRNSIINNSTMTCLDNETACTPATRVFELYNSAKNVGDAIPVVEVRQGPGAGLDLEGKPCNTFPIGAVLYNPVVHRGCILKFVTTWTPICGADVARCKLPSYRLNARLTAAPGPEAARLTSKLNLGLFNVEIVRDSRGELAEAVCNSLANGVPGTGWNPITKTCALGMNQSCPAGQIFVGTNAQNQKICRTLNVMSCPRGTVVRSIAANGEVTCARGCYLNITCTMNPWTGANTCPGGVHWVPGQGIAGHPALAPFARYIPPPPPPDGADGDTY